MTTYPLATLAAQVTSAGISAPSYADVYASLQASFKSIYGSDAYIAPDSQDGQMLAVFAQAVNDGNAAAIAVYNSFSPSTGQGAALSSNVKINGLARLIASNSTADLTVIGQAGTVITNGIAADSAHQWALPASVVIPTGGSIIVTATCQTLGAITAAPTTINKISTPTRGWQSVSNAASATIGAPVESDAALRVRQYVSTSLPAQSILSAIYGSIANLPGVTQLKVYENDTGSVDANGIPAHSISVVALGGDTTAIAQTIEQKKAPGTGTYGTTTQVVFDTIGIPITISYYRPTIVPIDINITIKAYSGYVSPTGALITSQITAYLNSLGIGGADGAVFNSKLYAPADNTGALANSYNVTVLTMRRDSNSFASTDIPIAFNELPAAGVITLTVV